MNLDPHFIIDDIKGFMFIKTIAGTLAMNIDCQVGAYCFIAVGLDIDYMFDFSLN